MWKAVFLLFYVILMTSEIYAEDLAEKDVLVLTEENFDVTIDAHEIILVEFYAPWCGHCQALAPEYAKAASMMKTASVAVPFAKIDATKHAALSERFAINSYPTLFYFRNGEKFEYDGPRDAMGIVEYMREKSDPLWRPPPSAVVTVTSDNFSTFITSSSLLLMEFYAPWCGHCKRLAPEYEKAAKELRNFTPTIPLAKIDGTVEAKLAEKYNVHGWPTLLLFRNGKPFEYKGPRTASGIVNYMKEQTKPPSFEVSSTLQAKNFFNKLDITVLGIFSNKNSEMFEEFKITANNLRERFVFLHSFSSEVHKHYDINSDAVAVYQPEIFHSQFEKPKQILDSVSLLDFQAFKFLYTDFIPLHLNFSAFFCMFLQLQPDISSKEIENFIIKHSVPLVGLRTTQNSNIKYSARPLVVVYYDANFDFQHRVATQLIRYKVVKVANEFPQIIFCVSQEDDFQEELNQLGLDESGADVNVGFFDSNKKRYSMEPTDDFDEDILREFVKAASQSLIEPHILSQAIPQKNEGPVTIVVAKTFDSFIMQSNNDVLIEFYAPWCGHCKALEPVYTKLAKKLNSKDLTIAKMDATANDIPEPFHVSGFPTIYFLPADKKNSPILFDGADRNIKTLTEFVNKHSFHKKTSKIKEEL